VTSLTSVGLDKAAVLAALYNRARRQGMGMGRYALHRDGKLHLLRARRETQPERHFLDRHPRGHAYVLGIVVLQFSGSGSDAGTNVNTGGQYSILSLYVKN
jgi:hypothetical protein